MAKRPTFEQACARYVNRFTMEHVPQWSTATCGAYYYAPQFATDREWYEHTKFPGDVGYPGFAPDCYTTGQTWPLGQWLLSPYRKDAANAPAPDLRDAAATLSWLAVQFRDRAKDDGEPTSIRDAEQVEAALKAVLEALTKVEE